MITAPSSFTSDNKDDENGENNTNEDTNGEDEDQEQCAICLVEYEAGDEISWSHNKSCNHAFHRECIIDWLISHDECPCCRHNYLSLCDDDDEDGNVVVEGGGGGGGSSVAAAVAAEEGRNRVRPLPVVRDQGDQLVRGLHLLYEFSRVPGFPSHALLGSPNNSRNYGVGRNARLDTPAEDAPSASVAQIVPDIEIGMVSPVLERAVAEESETMVQDETQTTISVAPEQGVDASSSKLNAGSCGNGVRIPDVPPMDSSEPSEFEE